MHSNVSKLTVTLLLLFNLNTTVSIHSIKSTFGSNLCIPGSISTITIEDPEILAVKESNSVIIQTNNSFIATTDYSNSLSKLHELSELNEIDYYYTLVKEEGPPHNKLYTVSLTLGDEQFTGQGSSLKKAQQKCATIALENTEYEVPAKQETETNNDATTPTVLLNNFSAKLGMGVEYFLVKKNMMLNSDNRVDERIKKTYLQKLNESLDSNVQINKDGTYTKGPFKVGVQVGDDFFYGEAANIQSAKHEAAARAIDHLIKVVEEGNSVCLKKGSENECKQAKNQLKSPISLVYEAATLRNLPVEFEIIDEYGPSHKKVFVTKCTLADVSSTGEGKSKKESKKIAAINMLARISELPEVSLERKVNNIVQSNKQKKKKTSKKVLKTNFDTINKQVDTILKTVKEFGLPFKTTKDLKDNKKSKNDQSKYKRKSFQDEILELGNALKFEVQFMDVTKADQFYTIMSLHINPEHICLGEGSSTSLSRSEAAKGGLILLQNADFASILRNTKLTVLETEIKQKIKLLLKNEFYEDQTEVK